MIKLFYKFLCETGKLISPDKVRAMWPVEQKIYLRMGMTVGLLLIVLETGKKPELIKKSGGYLQELL